MISLSLVLFVVGLSELACNGLAEGRLALARALGSVAGLSLLAGLVYLGLGASLAHALVLGAPSLTCAGSWLGFRQARMHRSALGALGVGLGIAIVGNALLGAGADLGVVAPWIVDLRWYDDRMPLALHLLVAALLVFLGATGNAVVRTAQDSTEQCRRRKG